MESLLKAYRVRKYLFFFGLAILLVSAGNSERWHTVKRVVDDHTVVLDNGVKVRLPGVDTPETVHPNKPVEYYGKEASVYTKKHLEGKRVKIVFDNPENKIYTDKYERWVVYVYLQDGTLFNAKLIRDGYAHVYTKYPFSKMEKFSKLEREAKDAKRGIWRELSKKEAKQIDQSIIPCPDWPQVLHLGYFPQGGEVDQADLFPIIAQYLSSELKIEVKMMPMKTYDEIIEGLAYNILEGAFIGPFAYVKATGLILKTKNYFLGLVLVDMV